jgi:uncharacterized protein YndB with AHSA1/START domain
MSQPHENTLTITRRFKAPRERVFAAFSSLEAMKCWLGPGPCGVVGGTLDFRVGGSYRMQLKTPGGDKELMGTYHEIDPPARLVFTWQWADGETVSVITVQLTAVGAETELRLTQTGFASGESRDHHNVGWGGSFDKLDGSLAV